MITLGCGAALPGLSASLLSQTPGTDPKPLLRFAIASDGHYGQEDTDFKRFHNELIDWINNEHSGKGLDFMVFNGDLVNDNPEFLPELKTYYDRLAMPYYVVKGNHDKATDEYWTSFWGTAPNHSFERDGYGFIFAYTSNPEGKYLCADTEWIQAEIEKYSPGKGIFVFMHIAQSKITRHSISCPEAEKILCGSDKIRAVFLGHDHDIDNKIYVKEKPFIFDGHYGGSWGTNYRGYRIVEVFEKEAVTYQCNPAAFYENINRF